MTPDQAPNERVTLAIVQTEVKHVRADIELLRKDIVEELKDHETRLRSLEKVTPIHSVAQAITGIVAVVAVVLGIKQP